MTAPTWLQQDLRLQLPEAVRGKGIRLWDSEGREYLDACSGAVAVISVGHGVAEVADAMADQARTLAYVHSVQFRHSLGEKLAEQIVRWAPGSLDHVCFYSGGSEAMEAAVKLARHYHLLRGNDSKHVVLFPPAELPRRDALRARHGRRALAAGAVPPVPPHDAEAGRVLPVPVPLRRRPLMLRSRLRRRPGAGDRRVGRGRGVVLLRGADRRSGRPGMTPPPGYYERIREICRRDDILFVSDEVVTGWGRTGKRFGIEHWDAEPDMIVSAKGVSGGYMPLSTVIFSDEIADVFAGADTPFVHNLTYEAHPVAAAAALAVLGIIERDGLVDNAAREGEHLFERLHALADVEPLIGDVRGKGLLAGIELVADRETRRPLDPELGAARRLQRLARARGLMIYPGAGGDGVAGDQLLVSPPLVVTREDVDLIVDRLALSLGDLHAELGE